MRYNAQIGKELMQKYLGNESRLANRLEHSIAVGDFSSKVARKIAQRNPELIDAELCEFLGYSHDIGYSVTDGKHEVYTVGILLREGVDSQVARKAMHGQLVEQFGVKEGNTEQYMPIGIEGIALTYCDMSVRTGKPVTVRERATEIIERVKAIPTMPEQLKKSIEENMYNALPRFERYERVILALAEVKSAKEF